MNRRKKVVIIGAGGRANAYSWYMDRDKVEIAAVADPNVNNRKTFLGLSDLIGQVKEYDDWRTMLDSTPDICGAVITTPNHLHVEPAVECMKRGFALALEKPIAESAESCRRLLEARRKYDARVIVGFVMRSAPFYLQASRWIEEGRIGDVTSIQADELPHILTTSVMFRSDWRRYQKSSGGSLLEKCCHDLDMLTWMAGAAPVRVNSVAGRKSLAPRADRPKRCADCAFTKECLYYLPPEVYATNETVRKATDGVLYKFTRDNSACIYNNGHDIYDHQNVQIEYDNGVMATLTMDFSVGGKVGGRYLKIVGSKGVISGKLEDNTLQLHTSLGDKQETATFVDDGSGHAGANRKHDDAFTRMMEDRSYQPTATLEAGYLSAMLCFAADESVTRKAQVDVSQLMKEAGLKAGFRITE